MMYTEIKDLKTKKEKNTYKRKTTQICLFCKYCTYYSPVLPTRNQGSDKTYFMLNSTEHEILSLLKTEILTNKDASCFQTILSNVAFIL